MGFEFRKSRSGCLSSGSGFGFSRGLAISGFTEKTVNFEAAYECEGVERAPAVVEPNPDERIGIPVSISFGDMSVLFRLWIGPARHIKAVFEILFLALNSLTKYTPFGKSLNTPKNQEDWKESIHTSFQIQARTALLILC